jgi:hypothetical protein
MGGDGRPDEKALSEWSHDLGDLENRIVERIRSQLRSSYVGARRDAGCQGEDVELV